MKRLTAAFLVCVTTCFPLSLFAQAGDSSTSTVPDAPTSDPAETMPAEAPPTTEPAAPPTTSALQPEAAAPAPSRPATSPVSQAAPAPAPAVPNAESPTPSPEPVSLEGAQEFMEFAAEEAPKPLQPLFAALAGALGMLIAVLGIQQARKHVQQKSGEKCLQCGRSGKESVQEACATCAGTGLIEKEYEPTAECPNCEGSGEEPCPQCEGKGKVSEAICGACEGSGKKRDEDGEPLECHVCHGEGEAGVTLTRQAPCPDCKGAKTS